MADKRLIVALDYSNLNQVKDLVEELGDSVNFYKVGMELFYSVGKEVLDYLSENGIEEFAVCATDGYRAVAFQIKFMEAKVTGITEGELDEIESGKTYVVDKMAWAEPMEGTVLYENENY